MPAYEEPTIINVLPLEQVVAHFAYNVAVTAITIGTPAEPVIKWKYVGKNTISVLPASTTIPKWKYLTPTTIEISTPSLIIIHGGKPYLVKASLQIDGTDYSGNLFGAVNVNMADGSATTFSFNLYSTSTPSDFVGKKATISYQAADASGNVANTETIVIGVIREATVNVDKPTLIEISGYDYAGYHNELGQLYSGEITEMLTGTISITSSGSLSTGKSPIFNVTYVETAITDVEDGTDYYVDALTGTIYIPVSSKLLTAASSLQFQYVDPYESFVALSQYIANIKGWTIGHDGFTVSDYTEPKKQPIITLSNESIVDTLKKLYEIGGGKLDSSLFPTLRIYNEKIKYEGTTLKTFIESDIIFDSLQMRCSLDDVLTNQTVKSVQNTYSNVEIGAFEVKESDTENIVFENKAYANYGWGTSVTNSQAKSEMQGSLDVLSAKLVKEFSFSLDGTGEYQFVKSGGGTSYQRYQWEYTNNNPYTYIKEKFYMKSVAGRWVEELSDNKLKLSLYVDPIIVNAEPALINAELSPTVWGVWLVDYPQVDYSFTLSTKSVDYGEGAATTQIEVAGTQTVQKINIKLEGDVYEQPFIETQTQGEDLCKAILHERKFIYSASAILPLHKAGTLKLGNKVEILSCGKSVIGNLKNIAYNIDTESGAGTVGIEVKGLGAGI